MELESLNKLQAEVLQRLATFTAMVAVDIASASYRRKERIALDFSPDDVKIALICRKEMECYLEMDDEQLKSWDFPPRYCLEEIRAFSSRLFITFSEAACGGGTEVEIEVTQANLDTCLHAAYVFRRLARAARKVMLNTEAAQAA